MNISSPNQIKDHWQEQKMFNVRIVVCSIIAIILTGIVITRLSVLQVVDNDYYATQSQGNRIRIQPLTPTRGLIYDRNNKLLAENIPSYQLELTPEEVPDITKTLNLLMQQGFLGKERLTTVQNLIESKRRFDSIPIMQRLTDEQVARFAALRPQFPGVEIRARLVRSYPYGKIVSHAIGYVAGISAEDQGSLNPAEYAGTSFIGKVSLEREYEKALHGKTGNQKVLVNSRGRQMQVLETDLSIPGQDLILSLDIEAQITAEQALNNRRGAVVAIDPTNGDIIVLLSTPSFDPNQFISGLSQQEFKKIRNDKNQPLFNRAIRGTYPPGSTIKPIIALAGLEKSVINPKKRVFCQGYFKLPGRTHRYRDWMPEGHGWINMHDAIAQSCDTYFYSLAINLDIDPITNILNKFGLGSPTGLDIGQESKGLVPSKAWKKNNFSRQEDQTWFPGETVITGIGQGYMLATPLQLANATSAIAMRGERFQPSIVKGLRDPISGKLIKRKVYGLNSLDKVSKENWDEIIDGMEGVIIDPRGTAQLLNKSSNWRIAGKSGTAQVFSVAQDKTYDEIELAERMRDHALFVAFAPVEKPRIAIAVIVENGSSGSTVAGSVAYEIINTYLKNISS
ncbi:MAG: penicillin-binding protein 2 [Pseudomonadota bacterium]|nr:penicillin-binding protein 2 [Pseudomonadota bacterium]